MIDDVEFGAVPRALRYVSVTVLVAAVAMIFVGAWRVGVTWDEPIHVNRFNNYLHTGWYLGEGQLDHGQPRTTVTQQYVYAPATMLLLHGLGVLTGVEDPGGAASTAHAYAVRHLGIGLIGVVGILAVAGLGRLLFRRWDWAVVAAATIAVMPMWTGYSMFNVKDVPVATGCTVVTLGLAVLARVDEGRGWRMRVVGPVALAGGTLLAVGTRPGIWTCIAAGTGVLVVCLLLRPGEGSLQARVRGDAWRYRDLLVGYLVAGMGLYLTDPKVFGSPWHALVRSAFSSANFLGVHTSWTFVPLGVFLQVPILMLGFTAFGVFSLIRRLIRIRLRPRVFETRLLLVFAQTFTLPFIAIVRGSSLYGDLRQLLFAAPTTAVIVTYGVHRLLGAARAGADRRGPPMVAGVACMTLIVPLVEQAPLFPYNYIYYNAFASISHAPITGDYYRASGREIVSRLPADGRIVCSPAVDRDRNAMRMAHLDGWIDCRTSAMSPISPYLRPSAGVSLPPLQEDQFWGLAFGSGGVPDNCTQITSISRHLRWTTLRVARLARCTLPYPIVTTRTLRMSAMSNRGLALFDLGWLLPLTDGTEKGVLARDVGPASMTFLLAPRFAGHGVTLVVDTGWPTALPSVTFGGTPVPVTAHSETPRLEIAVPPAVVDRAIRGPLTLEFTPPSGSLDMKVMSISAQIPDGSS